MREQDKKIIVSVGTLLRDIGFKCGTVASAGLWDRVHGRKLDFSAPAGYEVINGGKQVVVDFSMAKDGEIAGLGRQTFDLLGGMTSTPGGGASNTIAGMRRLTWYRRDDLRCQLVAKIGARDGVPDEDGQALLRCLDEAGVERDLIQYDESASTGRSLVLSIERDGMRDVTYLVYRGAAVLNPEALPALGENVVGGLVANNSDPVSTLKSVRWLAGGGRRMVYISSKIDMAKLRDGDLSLLDGLENVVMTCNTAEFAMLGGDKALEAQVISRFTHAVITDSTAGLDVYRGPGKCRKHYDMAPDRPVSEVPADRINPNGAGDSMSGSLAVDWVLHGEFSERSLGQALCVAASICTRHSTTGGLPRFGQPGDAERFVHEWHGEAPFDFAAWGIE